MCARLNIEIAVFGDLDVSIAILGELKIAVFRGPEVAIHKHTRLDRRQVDLQLVFRIAARVAVELRRTLLRRLRVQLEGDLALGDRAREGLGRLTEATHRLGEAQEARTQAQLFLREQLGKAEPSQPVYGLADLGA